MKNKWIRVLVCFVMVCCILVNISPIRAKSVVVDAAIAVSGVAVLTWAAMAAAGVVYIPQSVAQLNAMATSLDGWWQRNLQTDEEWEEYKRYVDEFNDLYLGFMEPDAPRPPDNNLLKYAVRGALATALAGFTYSVIKDQAEVEAEEETTAPDGFAYYNGVLLPILPEYDSSEYPYALLVWNSYHSKYQVYLSQLPLFSTSGQNLCSLNDVENYYLFDTFSPTEKIEYSSNYFFANYQPSTKVYSWVWANYDVTNKDGSKVYLKASPTPFPEYTSTTTAPVLPDTYVGDIPDQVKDGSLTAENLTLPDTFNLSSIVTSPDTAFQDIQNVAQQLSSGVITYNDFITNITYTDDPGSDPDPTEPTNPVPGGSTDPTTPSDSEGEDDGDDSEEDEEEKLEELEFYTLDLTEFFPFCIPFDIYEFFSILSATPQAPVFDWPIVVPALGLDYTISVDLSPWNDVAALFRKLELMAFIVGLGFVTRKNFLRG